VSGRYSREISCGAALLLVLAVMAAAAPSFFSPRNLEELLLNNASVLVVAIGMTLVILAGHIDISVGSQFAIASVITGLLARGGAPIVLAQMGGVAAGVLMGTLNGVLVARAGIPSIVVTLASMVALRDALRWATEGKWVQNLPDSFQWAGFRQSTGELLLLATVAAIFVAFAWALANLPAGRELYATGSDPEAARLAGIRPPQVVFRVFVWMGLLTGAAAALNAVRFSEVQGNAGVGLELKAIAAVVVGGASITGGRATLLGTLLGVLLLGVIGPALTFLGVNAFWEKAIQGVIILAAVVADARGKARVHAVAR
jgi:ribose/xylose/arabinose/galactoside ABC-type transport system permease subunit